jgi:broad specificity phosphatase PhoE
VSVERVVLTRHGESTFSVRETMNGDPAVSGPLTEAGEEQARKLGKALAGERIDLCATSEFERAQQTADLVLAGRNVPRLVVPELNDIRVGDFEGKLLGDYRAWAATASPLADAPGGGESRAAAAARYARAYRTLLARPEPTILVVAHGLPIRYVLLAAADEDPTTTIAPVKYAVPHRLGAADLERAVARLERWARDPVFASP